MTWTVTITSQRQITIPAELFRQKVFRPGEKVLVESTGGGVRITPAVELVRKLAGSVPVPKKFKGLSADKIIEVATKEYFRKAYKSS